ncbi:MAG: TetR/AcrR family transcriptional regulator, partial [Propionibacteriaceae bacterium]|nr:TetR/AcrR family transcriptional regulator [Propionibacteriaceae bacterium]
TMLREFLTHTVVKRIAAKLSPDHAQLRVALVGSQLAGLAMARYVIQLPPLASVSTESLVTAVAPNLQRYLTGDLGLI